PLARQIDRFVRPFAGVVDLAAEGVAPGDVGNVGGREHAGGQHEEAGGDVVPGVGGHRPSAGPVVVGGGADTGEEVVGRAQVVAVGDMLDVAQDLLLRGEPFGPGPFLLQLLVERVGVVDALDIAAGAGIAVVVPGAADAFGGFESVHAHAEAAQFVHRVQAGDACPDDDGVE